MDAHRKARQAQHPELTLTGLYSVLTKLRGGDPLTAKEKVIHGQGLVSVLQKLHDDLDRAVLDAYGRPDIEIGYAPGAHFGMAYHDVISPGDPLPDGPGFVPENRAPPLTDPGLMERRDLITTSTGARRQIRLRLALAPQP